MQALLRTWPARHVAKCLVAFDAGDEPALLQAQLDALRDLIRACIDSGRELLLEVIPPRRVDGRIDDAVTRAIRAITAAGVLPDWWKLAPPQYSGTWAEWADAIHGADPHCRGVLLLGLDAPLETLADQLARAAAEPLCRGFAVGRTIFGDAARAWFERRIDDESAITAIAERYRALLQRFASASSTRERPTPNEGTFARSSFEADRTTRRSA